MTTKAKQSTNETMNVAQRLRERIRAAQAFGFEIRHEVLDDQTPGWCQIGSRKLMFVDLAATTAEQLAQVEEFVEDFKRTRAA